MSARVEAHIDLDSTYVAPGEKLGYRIVNDGVTSLGHGGSAGIQRFSDGSWTSVSPAGWHTLVRHNLEAGKATPWRSIAVPDSLAAGRYRVFQEVNPPFERQGLQPTIPLFAEFTIS